jgi:hypothetical protein
MAATRSSETSVLTKLIPKDGILYLKALSTRPRVKYSLSPIRRSVTSLVREFPFQDYGDAPCGPYDARRGIWD